jgi:hypothetical protein
MIESGDYSERPIDRIHFYTERSFGKDTNDRRNQDYGSYGT